MKTKAQATGSAEARKELAGTLEQWQEDPDLSCVREADSLAMLLEGESAAWQALWAEIESLLKRSRTTPP